MGLPNTLIKTGFRVLESEPRMTDKHTKTKWGTVPWVRGASYCCLFLLVFAVACDESLPPRVDPSNFFLTMLQSSYHYTQFENDVVINLVVVNKFDETLDDHLGLDGTITITSDRDTSVHKTFQLSRTNLTRGNYNPGTGMLTFDPGDTVVLQVTWDFTDDVGGTLIGYFFHYNIDRTCKERDVADQESFNIAAQAKLYSVLGYAQCDTSFSIIQYDRFIGPRDCIPL